MLFYHYDLGGVFPSAASARLLLSYCDEWKCRCGQDFPVLDTSVPEHGTVQKTQGNEICFSHVNFAYTPDTPVLRDVAFSVPEGRFVALVGESGCGKSTIASLVMGKIVRRRAAVLRSVECRSQSLRRRRLYRKVTRVRHDSYLFAGTVEDNLRMGKADATQKEMEDALLRVDLLKTIREKGGLAMQLEERAANLSGGQKQRLVLARRCCMTAISIFLTRRHPTLTWRVRTGLWKSSAGLPVKRRCF